MATKNDLKALAAEIEQLTERAKETPVFALKPLIEQLAEKQSEFNRLLADLI